MLGIIRTYLLPLCELPRISKKQIVDWASGWEVEALGFRVSRLGLPFPKLEWNSTSLHERGAAVLLEPFCDCVLLWARVPES